MAILPKWRNPRSSVSKNSKASGSADGDRFMLTHYCVAGSQPRLAATAFEEEGKVITFTFLDATNLKSRDQGHMDKAVFRFKDENSFTTQWTWYQNGKESWMEEIRMERQP